MRERCRWLGGRRKTPSQVVWKPLFEVVLTVWKRGEGENKLTKWEMFTSKYFRQVFLGKYPLSGKTSSLLRFKRNTTAWIEWRAGSLAFGPAIAWESARGQSMVALLQSASGLVAQIYDTDTHWLEETVKYGGIREVERRGGGGASWLCLPRLEASSNRGLSSGQGETKRRWTSYYIREQGSRTASGGPNGWLIVSTQRVL